MAHPFNSVRADNVMKSRVGKITAACSGGVMRAAGGGVGGNGGEKAMAKGMIKRTAMKLAGGSVTARSDRPARAKGGRVRKSGGKKGGHTTNVIIAPGAPKPPATMVPGVAAPPAAPPAGMPPRPVAPPPGAGGPPMPLPGPSGPPMGGPPGMPPPMRAKGGKVNRDDGGPIPLPPRDPRRIAPDKKGRFNIGSGEGYAKGGKVSDASVGATPIQHSPNKMDGKNIGRGAVITKATGGAIYASATGDHGPKFKGGGMGGVAKIQKMNRAIKSGYGSATRTASNPTNDPRP